MFADPQSVTINAIAKSLPRVGSGPGTGSFSKDDGEVRMNIAHAYNKRVRRLIRLDHKKLAVDVMDNSLMVPYNMSVQLVVDHPLDRGYSIVEQKQIADGFLAFLTASSGAKITQWLGGEA